MAGRRSRLLYHLFAVFAVLCAGVALLGGAHHVFFVAAPASFIAFMSLGASLGYGLRARRELAQITDHPERDDSAPE